MSTTVMLPQQASTSGGSPNKWLGLLDLSGQKVASARAFWDGGSSGSYGFTNTLKASGFAPAVPDDVTITGVSLRVRRVQEPNSLGTVSDNSIKLTKVDGSASQNKSMGASWSTTIEDVVFGGETDLWGFSSLTPAEANNPAFTASLVAVFAIPSGSLAGRVEAMELTVHHS